MKSCPVRESTDTKRRLKSMSQTFSICKFSEKTETKKIIYVKHGKITQKYEHPRPFRVK